MSALSDKKRRQSPMTATGQSTFRICGNDDKEKDSDAMRIGIEDHKGGSVLTTQFFHLLQSNGGKWQGHRFGTEVSTTCGCEKWNRSKISMEYHLEFGQNMAGIMAGILAIFQIFPTKKWWLRECKRNEL
jgi:hypothetical protein